MISTATRVQSPPGRATVYRAKSPLNIVHVTAEMAPCAKVGGLADVVQGLAKASLERGHNVQVRHWHRTRGVSIEGTVCRRHRAIALSKVFWHVRLATTCLWVL